MSKPSWIALAALALRQLMREARAGELQVLFMALLVAVASSTAIGYFGARLNGAMQLRASEFLGADLVLSGSSPAAAEQRDAGLQLGLDNAQLVEFSTVAATDRHLQLISVKAASAQYPLRGAVRSAAQPFATETAGGIPAPGEMWVEARLLSALDLSVGDHLEIGELPLRITRVLTYEPDRANDFYSLTPHALINLDDLAATGVVQPGSRVRFRELWRGSPVALQNYRDAVQPRLEPHQRIETVRDNNRQLGNAITRAERYLNLASLAAILLAGVAVALSATRFASRRFDASALLRCLGLSRRQTLVLFGLQLTILGLLASLAGALLGWLAQQGLFYLLRDLLVQQVPTVGPGPALIGMATGLVALAGFALPPLAALGRVPPLRVLRRDLLPVAPSTWFVYLLASLALGAIMWRMSLDLRLTAALMAGGISLIVVLGGALLLGLSRLRKAFRHASLPWRLGLGQLLRNPVAAAGQSLAFGLILLAMALVLLLRSELLDNWQAALPAQAPNQFVLNVLPDQRDAFQERVTALSGQPVALYPIVMGRLVEVNDEPVRQRVSKESQGDRATRRDLSLTWSAALPAENRIVSGQWWDALAPAELPGVSVDSQLAENLGIGVGDRLTFSVGAITRQARVTSLRKVDWNSFQPNFFIIFQPGTLSDLPTTYMTSFHLPPGREGELIRLAREFPSATLLQVDALIAQIRSIIEQVSLAVEYVLLFVLAAGMAVLFAGLQATLDERLRQGAVLRALGARRGLLNRARLTEFSVLGATAGLLAAIGCEVVSGLLYRFVFSLPWQPHPWLLLLPVFGALLIGGAGYLGTRRSYTASPLLLFREI